MSTEERKRLESVMPRKRQYDNGGNNGTPGGGQQNKDASANRAALLKLLGLAPENQAARAICYNCQKPGHYAKNCPEPKKVKVAD